MKVEFYRHNLDEQDIANVVKVLHSVFLTTGPVTAEFERRFAEYTGVPNVLAVNSCTAAMQMTLMALGVGPGDEVIVPAMTFIASATCVVHAGATPVLVDVDPETGCMDPEAARRAVTPRTKAILPVHLYGVMADMKALRVLADEHKLFLVEDCAHCVEGERDGVRPGHLSDAACYSFYATKNLACGEGGALITRHEEVARKAKLLSLHGMSKNAAGRYHGLYQHWDMLTLGWKCNLDDIHSALLVDQLGRLDALWARRNTLWKRYEQGFEGTNVARPKVVGKSGHHLYTVWADPARRDALLPALQQAGVGVAVNFRAIHLLEWFRETFGFKPGDFPNAEAIGDRTISLPFYPKMTDAECDYVIETVRGVFKG
ncbi:UDP-4-amino-4-deoxy-L-arabinose--oxoglutarate aminotransferase [Fundidesulfovibrio magnetotacticus]|uniref:UDP-4-amino-4-deoxy-L-arabinose--oxoglutarate aminotransferase n=1 Tax=Fundidesulfovibrio magnetotacticus TaxID=2730080 RepID=A0A6V8M021_9BACT|nr:DegT/DnrJ/EryC1/StrS family aminotransferase [Fundidesulfovibrio magnetotacticus]GFK93825.1 UDP-4-amino-4-deoxy-L-arabinose--oxoglutarate aminotransferase [Fundidesulfovibrio magnetotacticus]